MTTRILLALCLSFALAACGGDAPKEKPAETSPSDEPTPGAQEPDHEPRLGALHVDLDDATLTELLALRRQVLKAGDDVTAAMAVGARTERDYGWYASAMHKWQTMRDAATEGVDPVRSELELLDKRLAEMKQQLAAATGDEKQRLEELIALQERMRPGLAKHVENVKDLVTPEVKALVATWKPRFEALEAEFRK